MIAGALAAEGVALYYQYALNRYPCELCIHVRIWVAAFVLVGALGLVLKRWHTGLVAAALLSLTAAIGLAERSWATLATERGLSTSFACSIDLGLPAWFALDEWLPAVFQVQAPCGVTPVLLAGVTMAEGLVAISVVAVVVTALVLVAALLPEGPRAAPSNEGGAFGPSVVESRRRG